MLRKISNYIKFSWPFAYRSQVLIHQGQVLRRGVHLVDGLDGQEDANRDHVERQGQVRQADGAQELVEGRARVQPVKHLCR